MIPFIGTETLISLGISLALSAISYGIQALLAPKPPTIRGPRKDDLGKPLVDVGSPIPFAVGRNLARGQIIWSSGLVETKNTSSKKVGKGGGKKQKTVTYTYSVSLAIAFNDGPVACVRRLLGNQSKVIYSERIGEDWTDAEIDAAVDAKYDEVYAAQETYWAGITDGGGNPLYTASQVAQTADGVATAESEALRAELESIQADNLTRFDEIEVFYGTETQEPSSIIEGFEGAGNVPAYRGTAYIVIQNLQLADFGNSTPVFDVDYVAGSGEGGAITGLSATTETPDTGPDDVGGAFGWFMVDYSRNKIFGRTSGAGGLFPEPDFFEHSLTDLTYTKTLDFTAQNTGAAEPRSVDPVTGYLFGWHSYNPPGPDTFYTDAYVYDPVTETFITDITYLQADFDESPSAFEPQHYPIIRSPNQVHAVVLSSDLSADPTGVRNNAHDFPSLTHHTYLDTPNDSNFFCGTFNALHSGLGSDAWCAWVSTTAIRFYKYSLTNTDTINTTIYTDIPNTYWHATNIFSRGEINWCPYIDADDDTIVMMITLGPSGGPYNDVKMFKWSPALDAVVWSIDLEDFNQNTDPHRGSIRLNGGQFVIYDGSTLKEIDLSDGSVRINDDLTAQQISDIVSDVVCWDDVNKCAVTLFNNGSTYQLYRQFCFSSQLACDDPVTLTNVVTNYLTRAGYEASEYTIGSELDDETIYGLNDNTGRTSREVLEDLSKIRPVNALESDGKLKFELLDQGTTTAILAGDVRAYDGSASPPDWLVEVATGEDISLPKALQITYRDFERLLNKTNVLFTRENTQSTKIDEFEVDAVDLASNMRVSVINAMSQIMATRQTFTLTVPQKYMALEPGDVVTVPVTDSNTVTARITRTERGANGIIEMTCALYVEQTSASLASKYGVAIFGADDFTEIDTDTATAIGSSRLHIIDTPYLTDEAELNSADAEDQGIYVAVSNDSTPGGASVYIDNLTLQTIGTGSGTYTQPTGEPQWVQQLDFVAFVDDGYYIRGLDQTATADVLDTNSELIVTFRNPLASFSSLTEAEALASQDNAFLIGNEIIQARTVTLLGTSAGGLKTYQFTNLWRGLQGTEWAISEAPASQAKVVHLDGNAIQRFDTENINLVGLDIDYRVVTTGQDVTGVSTVSQTFQHRSAQPYAPTIHEVVRDADGNLTFGLVQRSRYGHDWGDNTADFNSDTTNFEVDVYSGATVVRTITSSGTEDPTISYTAAQQVADFGSAQAAVTVRPYQLNNAGRRGFTNEETI